MRSIPVPQLLCSLGDCLYGASEDIPGGLSVQGVVLKIGHRMNALSGLVRPIHSTQNVSSLVANQAYN